MKKLLIIILLAACSTILKAQTNYQRDSLAHDQTWQQRVRVSSISAAKDILANTQQAQYLVNYCQLIISSPFGDGGWLDAMSYGVATAPAITLESTDSDIQFTVNANIDKYAKAYYKIID